MTGPPRRPRTGGWVVAGKLSAVAFEFTGTIAGSMLLGWFADGYFGTEPWLLILGALLGTCGGFYQMIRSLRLLQRRDGEPGT